MTFDCSAFREASQLTDVQKSEGNLDKTRALDKKCGEDNGITL